MAVSRVRAELSRGARGRSMLASIERLPCDTRTKRCIRLEHASSKRDRDNVKLKQ